MHKIESIQTGEKSIGTFYCAGEGFEPGASGVVLQCTNHYNNSEVQIAVYKHYFDNSAAELFFKIKNKRWVSGTKTCLFTMQYTKTYACAVLFLQDILLFD